MQSMSDIFKIDKSGYSAREIIKIIGVGGAGNNALNHIIRSHIIREGIEGVEFIAANTDIAHLELSETDNRIVLGRELTKGLGAGSDPEVGCKSALESREELRAIVEGADMVFIAAGMGGGTGTGAAPVIAGIAKEAGALVVAVVTLPFTFEGQRRTRQAKGGIEALRDKVDALIIIPNDKLLAISDKKTTLSESFSMADGVLHQAVQGVTDLIKRPGLVNVDFADVRTIMSNAGTAIMGIGEGFGEKRASSAAYNAINSPLMDSRMRGAKGVLVNFTGGASVGIHEINEAISIITEAADEDAFIIWGHLFDPEMEDSLQVTVIATGFDDVEPKAQAAAPSSYESRRPSAGAPVQRPAPAPDNYVRPRPVSGVTTHGIETVSVKKAEPVKTAPAPTITPQRAAKEQPREAAPKAAPGANAGVEDLFKQSGAPSDRFDVPAYLRRGKNPEK